MNNQFSENLKKIRKENNLSQEQLADELGVSRQAISKWESAAAYPEMDKIIALCEKFHVNIDDLLHNDIKEVKGEEESKKNLNNMVDDFLSFITDTISLFSNMTWKSRIKCLFEQFVIGIILLFLSEITLGITGNLFVSILSIFPEWISNILESILNSIMMIFCLIGCIIILTHVFKTRYLNYYKNVKEKKEERIEEQIEKEEKMDLKEDKIIIRDPKHSEYRFLNGLWKCIILIVKFFACCFVLSLSCTLIGLFAGFVLSFLIAKTGVLFLGVILLLLSSSVITIDFLVFLLNFILNRKNEKKKMIWSFILSIIFFGVGIGLIGLGAMDFKMINRGEEFLKVETREYEMKEDYVLFPHDQYEVEFKEEERDNIKVEYTIGKYDTIEDYSDNRNELNVWTSVEDPLEMMKDALKYFNKKQIIQMNYDVEKITIYASHDNVEKLKSNLEKWKAERKEQDEVRRSYEERIKELEEYIEELEEE